jgi:LacI family transcriptional regulator
MTMFTNGADDIALGGGRRAAPGKEGRAPTIKDVAKKAGVSIATVSHVLNKKRFVSDPLTDRVNEAVRELGYYPNLPAKNLRENKTYTVGFVIPSLANETIGILAESIQKILFRRHYNLIICNTSYDDRIEREALNTLLAKKVDAIIITPTCRDGSQLAEIQRMGIPIILSDRVIPGLPVDTVRIDYVKGTRDAITHLIELGHRQIGFIDRKFDQSHSLEKKVTYKQVLEEYGLAFDTGNVVRAHGFDYASGTSAAKTLLERNPRITALFAFFDITAFGAMRGLIEMGYGVPQDISVVGCDGMPFTSASIPRLTTIWVDLKKMAAMTSGLLMERLEGVGDSKTKDLVISPRLVIRDSTGPCPG